MSEDEYLGEQQNPYRGLSEEDVLALSLYSVERDIDENGRIAIVRDPENGKLYVRKFLTFYDKTIYEYLRDHPVGYMPRIIDLYEGSNGLIVIEEYIEGVTVAEMLEEACLSEREAVDIMRSICRILEELHNLPTPIIHRDIKPSNIIVKPDGEVILLDMNVAKWYDEDKTEPWNRVPLHKY